MKVKIKKIVSNAVIPQYAKEGDAGLDLVAVSKTKDQFGNLVYGTGLAIQIPLGHLGLLFPRSSVSKVTLSLANSIGLVDSGYRGEIICKFKPTAYFNDRNLDNSGEYEIGEKVCQLVIIPYPSIELEEVSDLEDSDRGSGGFGSTGA